MKGVTRSYAQLVRPANLPTAAADILAGVAISGIVPDASRSSAYAFTVLLLALASVCLYAGGVVLNDVFDAKIDAVERPERPIPRGAIRPGSAAFFGSLLLVFGVLLAFMAGQLAGAVAIALASAIVLYDAFSKKHGFLGPLNMGVCRGLNLLLGMAASGVLWSWAYALIPVIYIFAITLISRGEVHGNNRKPIILAGFLYAVVIFCVLYIVHLNAGIGIEVLLVTALFAAMVFRPLIRAYSINTAGNIKRAVMAGVLGLIVLDAALAMGFAGWWYGLMVLLLLPVSIGLSHLFAVT